MIARKCNICSKFYDYYDGTKHNFENANTIIFYNNIDRLEGSYYEGRQNVYDLCPECMNRVIELLDNLGGCS